MSRVELKSYKEVKSRSEETVCFNAKVYVDGKLVGEVDNDGRGGCHRWSPWSAQTIVADIAKTMPKYATVEFEVAESLIDDLGLAIALGKDAAKHLKERLVFEATDGSYGITGKANEAMQNAARTNQEWSAKQLTRLNGKRWITTVEDAVAVMIADSEAKRNKN